MGELITENTQKLWDKIKDLQEQLEIYQNTNIPDLLEQLEQKEDEAQLYRLKLLKMDNKIVDLEARNEKLEQALLNFKAQYPLSPWIINQVEEALGQRIKESDDE